MINRRQFIGSAATAACLSAQQNYEWGGPVLDIHLHLRPNGESNLAHIEGSGVTRAVLLTRVQAVAQAKDLAEKYPGRFVRFVSADVTRPESVGLLTQAVKDGALGLGEIKNQVQCDGPEMKRMYALAAELRVPSRSISEMCPRLPAMPSSTADSNASTPCSRHFPGPRS